MTGQIGFLDTLEPAPDPIGLKDLIRSGWTVIGTRSNDPDHWDQPWRYRLTDPDPHLAVSLARGWDIKNLRPTITAATIMTMQRRRACGPGVRPIWDLLARLVPVQGAEGRLW